jgi:uncharacterized protein (DUF2147 family)
LDSRQLSRFAIALLALAVASPAAAQPQPFEGEWANPKHSMVVTVGRCGADYCAVVVKASEKAQANARKGGTEHFIGTQILKVRPAGDGLFKGTAFDPESNMHVDATVRLVAPGVMDLKGCALFGLVCEEQRWTKVS